MFKKQTLVVALFGILITNTYAQSNFDGAWHLRALDGMEVRKVRAILDFNMEKMALSGFDACNRINGKLIKNGDNNISTPMLMTTRMTCRGKLYSWVSQRVHTALKEGFSLKEEKKYGIEGITLKSPSHELFFKKMGKK